MADAELKTEVAVVGTVNLDYTVRVEHLPDPGETVVGDAVTVAPGGKGANQAVAAARSGARSALIGCVGDDAAGSEVVAALTAEARLDVEALHRVPGATGTAFVTVDGRGANTIVSARGANRALDEDLVHRHGRLVADAVVLLVQLGVPRDAVVAALEIARSVGTITVLDPSPPNEVTDELLRLTDVCTPNETEAERLTGHSAADLDGARRAAHRLLARGAASVIVKLGERGAYYAAERGPDTELVVPAFAVRARDATGAGDAFSGALAVALARGAPVETAITRGAAAGALAATRVGAIPSLPFAEEVDALVAARGSG